MALARLALKKLASSSVSVLQKTSSCHVYTNGVFVDLLPKQNLVQQTHHQRGCWSSNSELIRRFCTSTPATSSSSSSGDDKSSEVTVTDRSKKSKWLPNKLRRRGSLRRNNSSLSELFSSGLGEALQPLIRASENINRLIEDWAPTRLIGKLKENKSSYKLRYEVPGLSKEDVKITIEDRFLTIKGEHKDEEEGSEDDNNEYWSSSSYGYYETSFMLPDDAKVEEIKAEMKDGILSITIPRTESSKSDDIKEIEIS